MQSVIALGDIHFPFAHKRALRWALGVIEREKPDIVVQGGDLYDMISHTKFPRPVNLMTPRCEMRMARRDAEDFWAAVTKAQGKKGKRYQLIGNHDERPLKRLREKAPEFEDLVQDGVTRLFQFDGVTTQPSEREELILNGVCFMHGYRQHGTHVTYNLMSTVCGHSHLGGVVYLRLKGKTLFELNCGYLGEPHSAALSYTRQKQISKWTLGLGIIDKYGPRFVPYGGK